MSKYLSLLVTENQARVLNNILSTWGERLELGYHDSLRCEELIIKTSKAIKNGRRISSTSAYKIRKLLGE